MCPVRGNRVGMKRPSRGFGFLPGVPYRSSLPRRTRQRAKIICFGGEGYPNQRSQWKLLVETCFRNVKGDGKRFVCIEELGATYVSSVSLRGSEKVRWGVGTTDLSSRPNPSKNILILQ